LTSREGSAGTLEREGGILHLFEKKQGPSRLARKKKQRRYLKKRALPLLEKKRKKNSLLHRGVTRGDYVRKEMKERSDFPPE